MTTNDASSRPAAAAEPRPTKAQRTILEALAGGADLFADGFQLSLMHTGSGSRTRVTQRTYAALVNAGWVSHCELTARGRAAAGERGAGAKQS